MVRQMDVKLSGQVRLDVAPGLVFVSETAVPVRCITTGLQYAIGEAQVTARDETVADVEATLIPALWLFGGSGLAKYSHWCYSAMPEGHHWLLAEVWLCEPGSDLESWPYTVETGCRDA